MSAAARNLPSSRDTDCHVCLLVNDNPSPCLTFQSHFEGCVNVAPWLFFTGPLCRRNYLNHLADPGTIRHESVPPT